MQLKSRHLLKQMAVRAFVSSLNTTGE